MRVIIEGMGRETGIQIAPAGETDLPLILSFINELAVYEKLQDQVVATLFGRRPGAEAVIARIDGEPAGFALFFHNFSTFLGRRGLYLEDLYVRPAFRGRAIGKSLLTHLARLAVERGCGRFEWAVLDWNKPARDFYESLGAEAHPAWINYRVTGAALQRLATGAAAGNANPDS